MCQPRRVFVIVLLIQYKITITVADISAKMDDLAFDHRHYVSLRLSLTTRAQAQGSRRPQYSGLFEMDVLTVSQRYDTIFDTHDLGHASSSINQGGRSKKRSTTNTSTKRSNSLSWSSCAMGWSSVAAFWSTLELLSIRLESGSWKDAARVRPCAKIHRRMTLRDEQVRILIDMKSVRKILIDDPLLLMQ